MSDVDWDRLATCLPRAAIRTLCTGLAGKYPNMALLRCSADTTAVVSALDNACVPGVDIRDALGPANVRIANMAGLPTRDSPPPSSGSAPDWARLQRTLLDGHVTPLVTHLQTQYSSLAPLMGGASVATLIARMVSAGVTAEEIREALEADGQKGAADMAGLAPLNVHPPPSYGAAAAAAAAAATSPHVYLPGRGMSAAAVASAASGSLMNERRTTIVILPEAFDASSPEGRMALRMAEETENHRVVCAVPPLTRIPDVREMRRMKIAAFVEVSWDATTFLLDRSVLDDDGLPRGILDRIPTTDVFGVIGFLPTKTNLNDSTGLAHTIAAELTHRGQRTFRVTVTGSTTPVNGGREVLSPNPIEEYFKYDPMTRPYHIIRALDARLPDADRRELIRRQRYADACNGSCYGTRTLIDFDNCRTLVAGWRYNHDDEEDSNSLDDWLWADELPGHRKFADSTLPENASELCNAVYGSR